MYKMYLGINNGEEGFMLPVLPEKIEFSENGDNKTYDIINLGEINTINKPKLMELSFESFFPKNKESYVSSEQLFEPSFYIAQIRKWRDKSQKIRFIFAGSPLEVNDLFTIENFKYREEGGEVGDIYYSMELKRYKAYAAKKVMIINQSAAGAAISELAIAKQERPVERSEDKTYTVVDGDTLFHISKEKLGDGSRWREIYNLNKDVIEDPDMIYPGQVFNIP